jgi:hypothetical protein
VHVPDPDQALSLAVMLACVARLVSLVELALIRHEFRGGGLLDWDVLGLMNLPTRTELMFRLRCLYRRLGRRGFSAILVLDALVCAATLAMPASPWLIGAVAALQLALLKRLHLSVDGSDQMILLVLVAALIARVDGSAIAARAAVTFLAAEVCLAYLVAGLYKAVSTYWQSGAALVLITRTRVFGHGAFARTLDRHPTLAHLMTAGVFVWECCFSVVLVAPLPVAIAILAIGVAFHVGCAFVMGLNTFVWAFVASYPALLTTNAWLAPGLGGARLALCGGVLLAIAVGVRLLTATVHIDRLPGGVLARPAAALK